MKMKKTVSFPMQCGACLHLTAVSTSRPRKYRPINATRKCATCGSTSRLLITKEKDGIACKSIEVLLTDEGRKHYYLFHPEKDPDYVQQDGNQDHQLSQQTTQGDATSDIEKGEDQEEYERATERCGECPDSQNQQEV